MAEKKLFPGGGGGVGEGVGVGVFCKCKEWLKPFNIILPPLQEHRFALTKKFACKMAQDSRFTNLFPLKGNTNTRSKEIYVTPICHTNRFKSSAIPAFIDILNKLS